MGITLALILDNYGNQKKKNQMTFDFCYYRTKLGACIFGFHLINMIGNMSLFCPTLLVWLCCCHTSLEAKNLQPALYEHNQTQATFTMKNLIHVEKRNNNKIST